MMALEADHDNGNSNSRWGCLYFVQTLVPDGPAILIVSASANPVNCYAGAQAGRLVSLWPA